MEMLVIIFVPFILMMAGASFLVVAQVSGFVQSGILNRRQYYSNQVIHRYMSQITTARNQILERSRELEALSSELALSNQELAQLNDMKSKFLSMVVHDVRTPLASIKGFSELLLSRNKEKKDAEYLNNILGAAGQLGRLIADLTDLAMIEAGKLKMDKAVYDFAETARDILPGILMNAQKKGVDLQVTELPDGFTLYGDKFRLSQALMNLLNNAVKFTPAGKKVELVLRREGLYAAAYVKDSGIGIHPSETRLIFQKFYQAKYQKSEKLRKEGWGLGLSIAQEIIRAHGGEIGASSPGLGKGSTFWFRFPAGM